MFGKNTRITCVQGCPKGILQIQKGQIGCSFLRRASQCPTISAQVDDTPELLMPRNGTESVWSLKALTWQFASISRITYRDLWLDLGLLLESLQLTSAVTETCYNSSNGLWWHWKWKKRPSIKDDQSSSMQQQLFMHVKQFHKVHNVQTNSSTKPLKVLDTAKLVHAFCRCDHDIPQSFPQLWPTLPSTGFCIL